MVKPEMKGSKAWQLWPRARSAGSQSDNEAAAPERWDGQLAKRKGGLSAMARWKPWHWNQGNVMTGPLVLQGRKGWASKKLEEQRETCAEARPDAS